MDTTAAALEEAQRQRAQKRDHLKQRVAELVSAGVTRLDIMSRLSISSSYYYRLVDEVKRARR